VNEAGDTVKNNVMIGYVSEGLPAPLASEMGNLAKEKTEVWANLNCPFPAVVNDSVISENVTFSWDWAAVVDVNYGVSFEYNGSNWPGFPDITPNFGEWLSYTIDNGFTLDAVRISGGSAKMSVSASGSRWDLKGNISLKSENLRAR